MKDKSILIIGEVFVDTHLDFNPVIERLGGIFHSARALSAINVNFSLAYYAPKYLFEEINFYTFLLDSQGCHALGTIDHAPNVMLINDSKEISFQGYYNILKDQAEYIENNNIEKILEIIKPTDIVIYPGRYNLVYILEKLKLFDGDIHIDMHYDSGNVLELIDTEISTCILSTSSSYFKEIHKGSGKNLISHFLKYKVKNLLVKENRGGSYYIKLRENNCFESPAYFVPTMHSVGVGDCFNSIFLANIFDEVEKNLKTASLCAAKYAETMSFDKFKESITQVLENINDLLTLEGIRLSWESRSEKNIYIAAPDFPDVNTKILEKLVECLEYHNFSVRLPIKENGLITTEMTPEEKQLIYFKDIELMKNCDMLIAVLLTNDPGTLVELGFFKAKGKPVIIFDPYDICMNNFVKYTPDFLCATIEEVIESTFLCQIRS